ncbi:DUF1003 domain-containing protein [Candidatus Microgenomates bacterium]|nr:DUF1003 domain-containing protein [Candidatus Microgenomates bacterium]
MAKQLERRKQFFRSFEAKSLRSRSLLTQIADDLTTVCGSTPFLFIHLLVFSIWIAINTGFISIVAPFDPFPFGLLTMFVSLEAIFLAIFVLVSQNRAAHINTVRDEVHMRVNLIAEEEITKILEVLAEIRKEVGIKRADPELEKMIERMDAGYIEKSIIDQLERANKPWVNQLIKEFPDILAFPVKKPIELAHKITEGNGETVNNIKTT